MRLWRWGGVYLLSGLGLLSVLQGGCAAEPVGQDAASAPGLDAGSGYVRCTALCVRPVDCAVAYSSGDVCPFGFECSTTYRCASDAGAD